MLTVSVQQNRYIDGWWDSKIHDAISAKPHTAANTAPDAVSGKDFRETIVTAVKKTGLDKLLLIGPSFDHCTDSENTGEGIIFQGDDGLIIVIEAYKDTVVARAWADTIETAKDVTSRIIKEIPKKVLQTPREDLVPVAFWHADRDEASCYIKNVQCPSFDDISRNYLADTKREINWLASLTEPDKNGKIILWNGPPGQGKTFCVRALARHWSNKLDATVEVILDPELMLSSAGYMRSVILNDDKPAQARKSIKLRKYNDAVIEDENDDETPPLRLIIVEDSAELFSDNCRSTPGFSRLLNLTDGIIGQGLRCIFLLTANEELGRIDPAIKRAGRCLQQLEFPIFTKSQAESWLRSHNCDKEIKGESATLADLYALKAGEHEPVVNSTKFGF